MKKMLDKYRAHFSEAGFIKKLGQWAKKAGVKIVYTALLLYYAYKRSDTPSWAKKMITGVLAYFIIPTDFVPDLTPYFGLTDDLSILAIGLTTVGVYVNKDVKQQARAKLATWFNDVDQSVIDEVESGLKDQAN